jgi:hypothetical protein
MWFFNLFKKKREYPLENSEVSAEALNRSIEVRQNEKEIRALQHRYKVLAQEKRIAELQADISDLKGLFEEEEGPEEGGGIADTLLTQLISRVLTPQNQQQTLNSIELPPQQIKKALTDDEIRTTLKALPKHYRKIAKNMSDEQLINVAKSQMNLDDDTTKRALNIFRNEKI